MEESLEYTRHSSDAFLTETKISSFLSLKPGWRFGEGKPPGEEMVKRLSDFNCFVMNRGLHDTNAFAGAGGEIMLTIKEGPYYAEFTFSEPNVIDYSLEKNEKEEEERDAISYAEAKELTENLCTLSASSTEPISILKLPDLLISALRVAPMAPAFPLLTATASMNWAIHLADT